MNFSFLHLSSEKRVKDLDQKKTLGTGRSFQFFVISLRMHYLIGVSQGIWILKIKYLNLTLLK